ncbi:MAG TPA: ribosome recycling factor [Saprospiraceae bacterium]|nr:ribosome recycling factor [Saprospiraceae bacterium]MCB9270805.1 ribosome recycling factor [Lewinellaceae bacterium]HPG05825.1 ribosome recycling factor [Saprospiraceae bacterium]HPQ99506.1 ribosome recycling factor [Saprospiraceae bacterium]HQU52609.1 ribosome recycling factor [Saprospiraceae bacterium]
MYEDINSVIKEATEHFDRSLEHLQRELTKIRTGKANTAMLEGVLVEYYGSPVPINQVANITASDSKTITIQPWERKIIADIERSIFEANLGVTPQNDGEVIRLTIPPLTEDRRKDLVKQAKSLAEDTRVGIRNERHKILDFVKKEVKNGYAEDAGKRMEGRVQDLVNEYNDKVQHMVDVKEKDIMTI